MPLVINSFWVDTHTSAYCIWENLVGEKLMNLANCELFAKTFLTDTLKMYLAYALTVAYSPNFPYQ